MSLLERFLSELGGHRKYSRFLAVVVQNGDSPKPEIIINFQDNFEAKKAYYALAYDEDLRLKANTSIQIIDWVFGDDFDFIQYELGMI